MAILWYKIKNKIKRNRYFLHTISAGFIFFVSVDFISNIIGYSLCPVYNFWGKKCLGCGMTRAFVALLHLNFNAAFEYNVLSIPLFLGIILYVSLGIIDIIFDTDYIRAFEVFLSKKYMYCIYVLLIVAAIFTNGIFKI